MIWKIILILVFAVGAMAQSLIFEMCSSIGADDKIAEVQEKIMANYRCFNDILNIEHVNKELEERVRNGTVKTALKKYCSKASQLKPCFHQYLEAVAPCQAQFYPDIFVNYAAIDRSIDFACANDGQNIAAFLADGGAQCASAKTSLVRRCVSDTLNTVSLVDIRNSLKVSCRALIEIHSCLISTVEKCPTPATVNFLTPIVAIVQAAHNCTDWPRHHGINWALMTTSHLF